MKPMSPGAWGLLVLSLLSQHLLAQGETVPVPDHVQKPDFSVQHSVDIAAPPENVWPFMVEPEKILQ